MLAFDWASLTGRMARVRAEYAGSSLGDIKALPESAYIYVAVPPLCEHVGLWHRNSYGDAIQGGNNVVSYPWHKWQTSRGENEDAWLALESNAYPGLSSTDISRSHGCVIVAFSAFDALFLVHWKTCTMERKRGVGTLGQPPRKLIYRLATSCSTLSQLTYEHRPSLPGASTPT